MQSYDYSLEGAYFVTIATYKKLCLFGEPLNLKISLNQYGRIAYEQWLHLTKRFKGSDFSSFVIMPNHIHGIISINTSGIVRGAGEKSRVKIDQISPLRPYVIPKVAPGSLGAIVRAYKASVTYRINALRDCTVPSVWQRNYFEHIIRNDKEYEDIWNYIDANPMNWVNDQLNIW